jgi:Cyclic nucleotide-binding domain
MRIESSVTSISWIPLGAVESLTRLPFEWGIAVYDEPPPERLASLGELETSNRFRLANELRAWIEVEDGRVVGHGQLGAGHLGRTALRVAGRELIIQAVPLPDLRPPPEVGETSVRFLQSAGGRTGAPVPWPVARPPFLRLAAPLAWSTLELTIRADGTSHSRLVGASPFPRHWVYDRDGALVAKTGLIDYQSWFRNAQKPHTPWGGEDSPPVVSAVESSLERCLSRLIIGGGPAFRRLRQGQALVEQGRAGDELYLLFDGILVVEVDGQGVAEVGPGSILGEMAVLSAGRRTATLRARTDCRVAVVPGHRIDRSALAELAQGRSPQVED